MCAIPRKPYLPLSFENQRGILCSNIVSKCFASVVRKVTSPFVEKVITSRQFGARRGGGTDQPVMMVQSLLRSAAADGTAAVVIFFDIRRVFYSVLPDLILKCRRSPSFFFDLFDALGLTLKECIASRGILNVPIGARCCHLTWPLCLPIGTPPIGLR